jgi:hypothetical protein
MSKDIQKQIEQALSAEAYIKKVSPKPFFYTRVRAKLENQPAKSLIALVPVSLRVVCSIVLIVNIAYFFSSKQKQKNESEQLASFYQLNSNSFYSN